MTGALGAALGRVVRGETKLHCRVRREFVLLVGVIAFVAVLRLI